MRFVYKLLHKHLIEIDEETGEEIFDTKNLGFFLPERNVGKRSLSIPINRAFVTIPNDSSWKRSRLT